MTIYERIKALREALGMSQDELAQKVGYKGRSAISKVEAGTRDISQSMIEKYAAALGVTPTYLLYGDVDGKVLASGETSRRDEFYDLYEKLSDEQRLIVLNLMKGFASGQ